MRTILVIALLSSWCAGAQQNLIRNGSFEEHGKQACLNCNTLFGQYPALVYHWDNGGWACVLCDKDYKQNSDEKKWKQCPLDRIPPRDGKAMIEMFYLPAKCVNNQYGYATFLTALSTQTLQTGRVYEVSCWLFIDSTKGADPDWARHIGIALLPQKIKAVTLTGLRKIPAINLDTVIYNKWYEVKWRIRPLCTSSYLMLGVFGNDRWPTSPSYRDSRYYIDKVSMTELPSVSAIGDSSIFYCSRYDPTTNPDLKPRMDNIQLRFETDAYVLSQMQKAILDSFAVFAKKYPDEAFEISGHTDNVGSQNLTLSQSRTQSVLQYLRDSLQLPEYRFILLALGSKRPIASNADEVGRARNRRVELRQSELGLPMLFYRRALQATLEQQYAQAFSFLNKWVLKKAQGDAAILLFDPRFDPLKKDKRWAQLEKKVKDTCRKLKYARYAFFIDSLRMEDFRIQGQLSEALGNCTGVIPELDSEPFYLPPLSPSDIAKKSKAHFSALRPILEKTGFPKHSEFGESVGSAFTLLMHASDSAACVLYLPAIKKACDDGEMPWIAYAKLYDRCQTIAGKLQRYMTQYTVFDDGSIVVEPWEGDENTANEYRAKLGLPLVPLRVAEAMINN